MPRRKGKPYNPARAPVAHDRVATDLPRNAKWAPSIVDDPIEAGAKLVVARSLRDDPLARLHVRRQIDDAQYHGGRAFQEDFEAASRGPQAIDTTKEAVDGGRIAEPITERQRRAVGNLAQVHRALGIDGSALVHSVLIEGRTCAQVAESRGLTGERWEKYIGQRLRECLDRLAVEYGFSTA